MQILTETVGLFAENTYFIVDEATLEAIVIDPGDEALRLLDVIQVSRLKVRYILGTHGHLDHVGAVSELRRATSAPFHLHDGDRGLLEALPAQAALFGVPAPPVPEVDGRLREDQVIQFGEGPLDIKVICTPGHSPGGVTFQTAAGLFVGDALFFGSIGRTDLPGGDTRTLLESIEKRILSFPDETRIYPGHGPVTTVGRERLSNPFLQSDFLSDE